MTKKQNKLVVTDGGLVGKYFHSFSEEGKLNWQGQIVGIPHLGYILVELFDWLTGGPNGGKLVPIGDATYNWNIYETAEEMNNNYRNNHGHGDPPPQFTEPPGPKRPQR